MDTLALVSRIILTLIFVVSGAAKIRDRPGTVGAMMDFGMPYLFARFGAFVLPAAELAIAALLVASSTYWWGAIAALLLLLSFTAAISYQLAQGRHPDCHCFGPLSSGPIGRSTLIRNGVLSVIALAAILEGWEDAGSGIRGVVDDATAVQLLVLSVGLGTLSVLAILSWISVIAYQRIARHIGQLSDEVTSRKARAKRQAAGMVLPPVLGEPAPILEMPALRGNLVDLAAAKGRELLLVFVRPDCGSCLALLPTLSNLETIAQSRNAHAVVVSRGTPEDNLVFRDLPSPVLLSPDASAAQAFGVSATPAALCIDADGNIASDIVSGTHMVHDFLDPVPENARNDGAGVAGRWWHGLAASTHRAIAMLRGANT